MRFLIVCLLFFMPIPAFAQGADSTLAMPDKGILIRSIAIDGFVLGDKERFVKIFKSYRNKYLTHSDMDDIEEKIQDIYEREGYKELVSISYQVTKHRLVYTVLMTS